MQGLMMNYPLTLTSILKRAKDLFADGEIVTREPGGVHRYTYGEFYDRVLRLMGALKAAGVKPGDRVATFAWNRYQHLELYFAVPCLGAVLHTLNIRLSTDQLTYLVNHAEDQMIFVDESLADQLVPLQEHCKGVERFVVMREGGNETFGLRGETEYEDFLASGTPVTELPELDENTACAICYTSGTTGNPKGALYSHRGLYLHTMAIGMADVMGLSQQDSALVFVPMFHVNAWGLPFAGVMFGGKLVFPGRNPQAADVVELIRGEGVTFAAGVPTIWMMVDQYLQEHGGDLGALQRVACGGSAVPAALMRAFDERYGVPIVQLWGMTELSPLGTVSRLKRSMRDASAEEKYAARLKAGIPVPGIEMRIEGPDGEILPNDGQSVGELVVRGPWVISNYFKMEGSGKSFTPDGWFKTGDVAALDADGYMRIADRVKDLIKSGGEWISSVDMENALMAHPAVAEAAVVARPDPKWDERPVAFLVPRPGREGELAPEAVQTFLGSNGDFAKWQIPYADDIHLIDAIPRTSVGKFDKKVLRRRWE
ncbi:long-chain fatty acid--CoA ligase [Immundisolibacter sp.]|uniref:long-chain fatty acid--CoA ligase n=1 Tax=Immundisolibacter sp. TaxID=1934948 RepID=UPI00356A7224